MRILNPSESYDYVIVKNESIQHMIETKSISIFKLKSSNNKKQNKCVEHTKVTSACVLLISIKGGNTVGGNEMPGNMVDIRLFVFGT